MFGKMVKVVAIAVLLVAVDMIIEVNFPTVSEINIYTEKLKKGNEVTLLQLSDFHGSSSEQLAERIVKKVEGAQPDAVLITGDLVDESTTNYKNVYTLIEKIKATCPNIFFVSGNHEWSNEGYGALLGKLKGMGVVVLNNKAATFAINKAIINICGVDDPYRRKDSIEKAMRIVSKDRYTVLLSHSPLIRGRLGRYSPDIILCGHTHGGQVRLPFVGAVVAPGEGFFPAFDKGMFKLKNGSLLYIDSGVGTSTLPIRLLNRSQISIIRVKGR